MVKLQINKLKKILQNNKEKKLQKNFEKWYDITKKKLVLSIVAMKDILEIKNTKTGKEYTDLELEELNIDELEEILVKCINIMEREV